MPGWSIIRSRRDRAASQLRRDDVDLIFLYVSTYALSSTVLPVVQETRVPVIVLCLQPVPQLDYASFNRLSDRGVMTGVWLEHCQACSAPEIASVFHRAGIDYHLVTGYLEDAEAWREIQEWVEAARVAAVMRRQSGRGAGSLLLRNAGCIQRPHAAIGCVRVPLRAAGNVRASSAAQPGDRFRDRD